MAEQTEQETEQETECWLCRNRVAMLGDDGEVYYVGVSCGGHDGQAQVEQVTPTVAEAEAARLAAEQAAALRATERVSPGVEDVMRTLASADADLPNWWGGTQFRALAEHVHALLAAQPTVAEVKAEALREFADWWDDPANVGELRTLATDRYEIGGSSMPAIVARDRADRIGGGA